MKLISEDQLLDLLELHRARAGSERKLARSLAVNGGMLNRVFNRVDPPGVAIPAALGYEPITMYRRIRNGKKK